MQKTILQVPIDQTLRNNAEKAALIQGFSSLQEMVRVFLAKMVNNKVEVTFNEVIELSDKSERRYLKITENFKNNKQVKSAKNVEELMAQLNDS